MVERGLDPDFPPGAVSEAARASAPGAGHGDGIEDLRHLLWASIDNDDSRDLDQLTVAEPLAGGQVRVLVAVADVDAAVHAGSAADGHARVNTTSVYTPAVVFPMLPERFSTDLTSLVEGEDRLAIVVSLTVTGDGTLGASSLTRAIVRNRAKLAYNSVAAWLDGRGAIPPALAGVPGLDDQIRLQDRVAATLRSERQRHGAMQFHGNGSTPVFDGDRLADLLPDDRNRAKDLIEDFMIAANTAVASFLESRGLPSLRRVLKAPSRWDRIVALAAGVGERLPESPDPVALQAMLARREHADPEHFPDLSLSVIKLLGSGEYAVDRPGHASDGHFGLAAGDYAHSTAPNRRYPDLVTQRLVKAALTGGSSPYSDEALEALAAHCTAQEDNAAKVERQVRKSAAALLLASRTGEVFDAIVTGASEKGTWVRIVRPPVEGRVMEGMKGLDVGDRTRVRLLHVDVERGFIDFAAM
jgi:exoribonuclease-2